MNRYWIYVLAGSLLEVAWVSGLKHSSTPGEWVLTVLAVAFSFLLILIASGKLPVGTVYIVFTGIGTAGTVAAEMLLYGEPFQLIKVLLIIVLLCGVIGLKWITGQPQPKEQAAKGGNS